MTDLNIYHTCRPFTISATKLKPPALSCVDSLFFFFAKTAMMHQGGDTRLILWCLALGNWLMILHGSELFLNIPQMLVRMGSVEFRDQITTLGSWPVFVLLGGHCHLGLSLTGSSLGGLCLCLVGWWVSSGIHMNASI